VPFTGIRFATGRRESPDALRDPAERPGDARSSHAEGEPEVARAR
jgi:hypothetical protein